MGQHKWVSILLRIGIATVFLYAAIAALREPNAWIGFLPEFLRARIPGVILLPLFSIFQAGLGFWILSGWRIFYAGIVASLTLVAIIAVNMALLDIVFRDVAILFAALALVFLHREEYSGLRKGGDRI